MKLLHDPSLRQSFDALLETYADRLVGDTSEETIEKVKLWALYNQIYKTMPALANHWNALHPEGKGAVRELFEDIKALNQKRNEQAGGKNDPTST